MLTQAFKKLIDFTKHSFNKRHERSIYCSRRKNAYW
jgi:hypothetical protein